MSKINHILNAIASIALAQQELEKEVTNQGKIIESQGRDIANLERQVVMLRNCAIQAEVANGIPSKVVAKKYELTPSRVTQIAPRKSN
jgi:Mg2+ and Co2+ transporter CorA